MFSLELAVALAYSAFIFAVQAQQLSVPPCAQTCSDNALVISGCDAADIPCVCLDPDFAFNAVACAQTACGIEDYNLATTYLSIICVPVTSLALPTYTRLGASDGITTAPVASRASTTARSNAATLGYVVHCWKANVLRQSLPSLTASGSLSNGAQDASQLASGTTSSSLSTGAKAGIGVGVSLGVLLAILAIVLVLRKYRVLIGLSKRGVPGNEQTNKNEETGGAEKYGHNVNELPAQGPRAELEAARRRGIAGEMP